MNRATAVTADLSRRQAEAAANIIGHTYRHRRTGRCRTVTDVVRWHRRGAKPVTDRAGEPLTDGGRIVYTGECIRVVLDDRVHVSPQAFEREWMAVR